MGPPMLLLIGFFLRFGLFRRLGRFFRRAPARRRASRLALDPRVGIDPDEAVLVRRTQGGQWTQQKKNHQRAHDFEHARLVPTSLKRAKRLVNSLCCAASEFFVTRLSSAARSASPTCGRPKVPAEPARVCSARLRSFSRPAASSASSATIFAGSSRRYCASIRSSWARSGFLVTGCRARLSSPSARLPCRKAW